MNLKTSRIKSFLITASFVLFFFLPFSVTHAVYVNGYYKSNGTYVQPYERTAPDGNPYNNYSYPGNYNPNTGQITGGDPTTYLNNYYGTNTYSSGYTGISTPTCPSNSYYDGISSCKCNYGYLVSGGSCVSANSLCWQQVGYSSSYDSISNTCKCDSGYVLNSSGQCTNANLVCSSQTGVMSQYNSISKKCECISGYTFNGVSCVAQASSYNYSATYSLLNDQACSNANGAHSNWNGTKTSDGLLNCGCEKGYAWNGSIKACVITAKRIGGLTEMQIQAILNLLLSFNADSSVVASVASALQK